MNKLRKVAGLLLIIAGVLMLAFPKLKVIYYEKQQQEILDSWLISMANLDKINDNQYVEIAALANLDADQANLDVKMREEAEIRQAEERAKFIQDNMEGILKIEKIDLFMPILRGVTEKNLNISLASIEEMGKVAEVGNYCISGHRSRTFGRQFNRLDELEINDFIEVIAGETVFQYEVFDKLLVTQDDSWVLEYTDKEKLLTLVTCDYSEKPSLRLIIKARLL